MYKGYISYVRYVSYLIFFLNHLNHLKSLEFVLNITFFVVKNVSKTFHKYISMENPSYENKILRENTQTICKRTNF